MRILIIDNEKIVRELLRDMIEAIEPGKNSIGEANKAKILLKRQMV